jgi:hypothetical protein
MTNPQISKALKETREMVLDFQENIQANVERAAAKAGTCDCEKCRNDPQSVQKMMDHVTVVQNAFAASLLGILDIVEMMDEELMPFGILCLRLVSIGLHGPEGWERELEDVKR